jgi:uncharacterized membrane protein YphA (DoxX/SURF4 family)
MFKKIGLGASHVSRILLGLVFIFSGTVKGIDPMGSAYKFADYFQAFKMPFLDSMATPLAFILCCAEFVIGVALVLHLFPKITAWCALIFMSFFTILTFILALTNPVTDCGCFGDAIVLTNWQTFYKNILLIAFSIIVFLFRKQQQASQSILRQSVITVYASVVFLLFTAYNYRYLPVLDFRPFKVGTYLPDNINIPEGYPVDEYKTKLVYEKNGVAKEFPLDSIPWQDTTWKWKETRSILVKEGYKPPIHDFVLTDEKGYDVTDKVLKDTSYTLMLISYNLTQADTSALIKANRLASHFIDNPSVRFLALTSTDNSKVDSILTRLGISYRFGSADQTMLKTVIRSNPGFVLVREGVVLAQWPFREMPTVRFFEGNITGNAIARYSNLWGYLYLIIVGIVALFGLGAIYKWVK